MPNLDFTAEPTFRVPARADDAAEDRQFSDLYADQLTEGDLDYLDPNERALAIEWRVAIERANQSTETTLHNAEPRPELVRECQGDALAAE